MAEEEKGASVPAVIGLFNEANSWETGRRKMAGRCSEGKCPFASELVILLS